MAKNQLIINHSKTKSMLFGTKHKLKECENFEISISGKYIELITSFEYLGVILGESMSWKEYTENISEKVNT